MCCVLVSCRRELFGKLSSVVKSKSAEMKEKLSSYIKNEQQAGLSGSVHTVWQAVQCGEEQVSRDERETVQLHQE